MGARSAVSLNCLSFAVGFPFFSDSYLPSRCYLIYMLVYPVTITLYNSPYILRVVMY